MPPMPTAVVIDGAFFLRRFKHSFPNLRPEIAEDVAVGVVSLAAFHVATRLQADPQWDGLIGENFDPRRAQRYIAFSFMIVHHSKNAFISPFPKSP